MAKRTSCAGIRIPKAGQIFASLQTVHHRFNIYASSCVALALWRGNGQWAPQTRYTLRRNTASIMKGLVAHHTHPCKFHWRLRFVSNFRAGSINSTKLESLPSLLLPRILDKAKADLVYNELVDSESNMNQNEGIYLSKVIYNIYTYYNLLFFRINMNTSLLAIF